MELRQNVRTVLDWLKPLQEYHPMAMKEVPQKGKCATVEFDEVLCLESMVVTAMARLQKSSFNRPECGGIDHCKITDFLSKRFGNLDGDIETQVITALQSGIKKGFICALRNGRYTLIGPSAHKMLSTCYNNFHHGPECTCFLVTTGKRHCCSFRLWPRVGFVKAERKTRLRRKKQCAFMCLRRSTRVRTAREKNVQDIGAG